MALSEFEEKRFEKVVRAYRDEIRPLPHIRKDLDIGYRIENQSVFLFEIRPVWRSPQEKHEIPIFKATYVKSTKEWKLYWMRASGKWELYEPNPYADTLEGIIDTVREDEFACFFG
jgi:hypothetical protein